MERFNVIACSPNGHVTKLIKQFSTFEQASDYVDSLNWEYIDLSGIEWELDIEEVYEV